MTGGVVLQAPEIIVDRERPQKGQPQRCACSLLDGGRQAFAVEMQSVLWSDLFGKPVVHAVRNNLTPFGGAIGAACHFLPLDIVNDHGEGPAFCLPAIELTQREDMA